MRSGGAWQDPAPGSYWLSFLSGSTGRTLGYSEQGESKPLQLLLTLEKDFIDSWKHVGDLERVLFHL